MTQQTEVQEVTTVSSEAPAQVIRKTRVMTPQVDTGSPQKEYETKKAIFRTYQIIWYILGVIEILLAFRIVLKLISANPYSGFVDFIYTLSSPFATPFLGILRTSVSGGSVAEWSTLIAMGVYAIIAWGVVSLFQIVKPTNQGEVEQNVDNQ